MLLFLTFFSFSYSWCSRRLGKIHIMPDMSSIVISSMIVLIILVSIWHTMNGAKVAHYGCQILRAQCTFSTHCRPVQKLNPRNKCKKGLVCCRQTKKGSKNLDKFWRKRSTKMLLGKIWVKFGTVSCVLSSGSWFWFWCRDALCSAWEGVGRSGWKFSILGAAPFELW